MVKSRNVIIDIAKLVFSICIVANHTNAIGLSGENFSIIFRFGFLGVEFFFIVSGYLMFRKASQIDLSRTSLSLATEQFILRKLSIVLPYLLPSWIFAFVIHQIGEESNFKHIIKNLCLSIPTLLQINLGGYGGYDVNGPTWYISAMMLSMLILYPIACVKKRDFSTMVAPLIVIFLYGYIIKTHGNYSVIEPKEGGFIYYGLLRGLAGISLGCVSYQFASKLSEYDYTEHGKLFLAAVEIASYLLAIYGMHTQFLFRTDITVVFSMFIAVTISFSQKSKTAELFKRQHNWLGKLSLCIYLSDAPARYLISLLMPDKGHYDRLIPSFIAIAVVTVYVLITGKLFQKTARHIKAFISNKMIVHS